MKTVRLFLLGILFIVSGAVSAQVSVNINLGSPPQWGPADYMEVRYYYLPDIEAYYDVQSSVFIYYSYGNWIRRPSLPRRYRDYDLYHGYKVVMPDYRGEAPYSNFKEYKQRYHKGYRGEPQRTVGERPDHGNGGHQGNNGHQKEKHKNK
jgi:hypothetical protein